MAFSNRYLLFQAGRTFSFSLSNFAIHISSILTVTHSLSFVLYPLSLFLSHHVFLLFFLYFPPVSAFPSLKHPVHGSILTKTQLVWVCMWAGCSSFIYASPLVRQPSSGAAGCSVQPDSAIVPLVSGTWNPVPH